VNYIDLVTVAKQGPASAARKKRTTMDPGELLTRWSVRLAMTLYVLSVAVRGRSLRWSRVAWTAGCGLYLLHVVCAFEYYHHWSHAEAYASTARQTAATIGLEWGGGLYANYAFTLVWCVDVCWWWLGGASYLARPRIVDWLVHGFIAFMAFNATVVFATGFSRRLGAAACLLLACLWGYRYVHRRRINSQKGGDHDAIKRL
jgi:hypothetical protein